MSLDEAALYKLKQEVKCRDAQIELLNSFVTKESSSLVSSLVVQGYRSIGKTFTVLKYLEAMGVNRTFIRCDECVTKKLLLQRCLKMIRNDSHVDLSNYNQLFNYKGIEITTVGRLCETFANFVVALEQFIEETEYSEPHVLVLDRFDQCMDATNEIFPGFIRLHEQSKIKNLTVIFIISNEDPREIISSFTPHIQFPPYSQSEVVEILQADQSCFLDPKQYSQEVNTRFWSQYVKVIVDSFFSYTGSNVNILIDICFTIWPHFTEPIRQGRFKPHEFIKLYRENRELLVDNAVVSNSLVNDDDEFETGKETGGVSLEDLPLHSKFILIASYLASFVEPKNDLHFFSRIKTSGGVARRKHKVTKNKNRQISTKSISSRLLTSNYFDLERLLAILSVIYRNEAESLNGTDPNGSTLFQNMSEKELAQREQETNRFSLIANIDINVQIATLVSLGFLLRTSSLDILSAKVRWKCNISWESASTIAAGLNFPLLNYLQDS